MAKRTETQKQTRFIKTCLKRAQDRGISPWAFVQEVMLQGAAGDLRDMKAQPEATPEEKRMSLRDWIEVERDCLLDDGARDYVEDEYSNLLDYLRARGTPRKRN